MSLRTSTSLVSAWLLQEEYEKEISQANSNWEQMDEVCERLA